MFSPPLVAKVIRSKHKGEAREHPKQIKDILRSDHKKKQKHIWRFFGLLVTTQRGELPTKSNLDLTNIC